MRESGAERALKRGKHYDLRESGGSVLEEEKKRPTGTFESGLLLKLKLIK